MLHATLRSIQTKLFHCLYKKWNGKKWKCFILNNNVSDCFHYPPAWYQLGPNLFLPTFLIRYHHSTNSNSNSILAEKDTIWFHQSRVCIHWVYENNCSLMHCVCDWQPCPYQTNSVLCVGVDVWECVKCVCVCVYVSIDDDQMTVSVPIETQWMNESERKYKGIVQ